MQKRMIGTPPTYPPPSLPARVVYLSTKHARQQKREELERQKEELLREQALLEDMDSDASK